MNKVKYSFFTILVLPLFSFADIEFKGALKNSFYVPSFDTMGDTKLRSILDLNFKTNVYLDDLNVNFGGEYSYTMEPPSSTSPLNLDEQVTNNEGFNIYEASLSYIDNISTLNQDLSYGVKVGRFENKTPFSNSYNKNKRWTGQNKTSLEGIVGEINHKYFNSYGTYFIGMNDHFDLSTIDGVKGFSTGIDSSYNDFSIGLNYIDVNYDKKGKPSTKQILVQGDGKVKNVNFSIDYLNQKFNNNMEDTNYIGLSSKLDLKIPINLRATSKNGMNMSNFDDSLETPVRSLNSNTLKMLNINDTIQSVNGSSDFNSIAMGVDLDFSKILKMKENSMFLTFDNVEGTMIPSVTYNDIWFNKLESSILLSKEPTYNSITNELDTPNFSIRGNLNLKF